jgi:hypothetical protein
MNLSFLILLILLILYYIIRQHKRDCIECNIRFMVVLGIVLGLYETYMYLSYEKIKNNQMVNANDIKRI